MQLTGCVCRPTETDVLFDICLTVHHWHKWHRQPTRCNNKGLLIVSISSKYFGRWFRPSSGARDCVYSLRYNAPTMLPAGSLEEEELRSPRYRRPVVWKPRNSTSRLPAGNIVGALYLELETQSSAPEDGRNNRPKYAELIGIINKPLLLHLFGSLYYLRTFFFVCR